MWSAGLSCGLYRGATYSSSRPGILLRYAVTLRGVMMLSFIADHPITGACVNASAQHLSKGDEVRAQRRPSRLQTHSPVLISECLPAR